MFFLQRTACWLLFDTEIKCFVGAGGLHAKPQQKRTVEFHFLRLQLCLVQHRTSIPNHTGGHTARLGKVLTRVE